MRLKTQVDERLVVFATLLRFCQKGLEGDLPDCAAMIGYVADGIDKSARIESATIAEALAKLAFELETGGFFGRRLSLSRASHR